MKKMLRIFLLLSITALMVGCKLAVIVVEGGEVQSLGHGTCVGGNICTVDGVGPYFADTFAAVPEEGWYFQRWNKSDRFFCAGSNKPVCTLTFGGYEETAEVKEMVASSEVFYLMPIFKPFQDTVRVDDKEWLQPDLFSNLSWKEINAACPAGVCAGKLNGYDMTGWTWASINDFNKLISYYLGTDVGSHPYTSEISETPEWAYAFLKDGWRTEPYGAATGWLRNLHDEKNAYYASIRAFFIFEDRGEEISTVFGGVNTIEDEIFHKFIDRGGWFYRTN